MLPEELKFVSDLIADRIGIIYNDSNFFQLRSRIEDLLRNLQMASVDELRKKIEIERDPKTIATLLDAATNNETYFFRDPNVFRSITDMVFPKVRALLPASEPFRIWSAACSTGQEIYSIFMALEESGWKMQFPHRYFFASDFSPRVLDRARQGIYTTLEVQRGLPAPMTIKYFRKETGDGWGIRPEFRQEVEFAQLNLLEPLPLRPRFHLLLCRNMLIYQTPRNKLKILKQLSGALAPGGFLVLGSAEGMLDPAEVSAMGLEKHAESGFYRGISGSTQSS